MNLPLPGFLNRNTNRFAAGGGGESAAKLPPLGHDGPKTLMAIMAHPDDIDFGSSGSIAKWCAEGWTVYYVLATSGDKGTHDPAFSPQELAATREEEQREAARILGVKEVFFLGYPDGFLEPTHELREQLVRLFRVYKPDVVLTWDAGARLQWTGDLTPPVAWKDIDTGGATTYTVVRANEFSLNLDALQEPPPRGTGSGRGTVSLSNNVLVVDVTYSGLSGNRNNSHFHAPAPRGQNAGVAYNLAPLDSATGNNTNGGTIRGTITLVDGAYGVPAKNIAAQLQDLRDGLWYLNVHSTTFGGGEIRGQLDPPVRFYRLISP
jgi:hypothetical protein